MAYNFDDMFKFNELNTYFDVHVAGLDGECFEYSIYFEGTADETRVEEISAAIDQWQSQYDEEDYLGYIDISLKEYHVFVYLDLGSIMKVFSSEETSIVYKRLAPLIKDMPGNI